MSTLFDDLGRAWRRLRRSPGFTAVAVVSLALAIGANTAVFGLVDAALFAPLPLPGADRIVRLWEERPSRNWSRFGVSAPAFADWRVQASSLAKVAAYTPRSVNIAGSDRPERVRLLESTSEMFAVLGVPPRLGRAFTREEETAGRDAVVLLAYDFWRAAFAADPGVVGRTVALDGVPHVVIGVLPPEVTAFDEAQLWRPLALGVDTRRGARWLEVIARLRPGVAMDAARAELAALARQQERAYPDTNTGWTAALVPLAEARAEGARPLLLAMWAAAGLVLLVAGANVAGLMLARAAEREGELAVRAALGADPARLARLMAVEGLVLAVLGGTAGVLVALASRGLLALVTGDAVTVAAPVRLDGRALLFTTLATLASGLLFSIAPAARARRVSLESALRAAGRGGAASRLRARRGLVVAELAMAVALVSATGLLARSVRRLLDVDLGFDPAGTLTLRVAPPQSRPAAGQSEEDFARLYFAERDRMAGFYGRILEGVQQLPGVLAAGAVNRLPLTGGWWSIGYAVPGQPPPPRGEQPSASGRVITPGYFRAMGIPVRSGRPFGAADTASAPAVAVVSESLARRAWPGEDPLGRRIVIDEGQPTTVVGVVGDVRLAGRDADAPAVVYVPFAQARFGLFPDWGMDLVVRARSHTAGLAAAVREQVTAVDPGLPVFAVRTGEELVAASWARRRAGLTLLGVFATLAVLLAAVGLYGVVAHSARQRTREIGVRMALGARPRDISRLVLGESLALAAAGAALGLAGAAASGRLLSSLLFGVRPGDPVTLAASAAALALVALGSAFAPARRASRLDPLVALRDD
jgi:putative ABC transport system permease protein